jgi:tetratricopeptide (TPR) repeat protein
MADMLQPENSSSKDGSQDTPAGQTGPAAEAAHIEAPAEEMAADTAAEGVAMPIEPAPSLPADPGPEPGPLPDDSFEFIEPEEAVPADAALWNEKGNVHFKAGAYEEAIAAYNKAIELDPAFGWPYSNLGLTHLTLGKYAQAILLYQKSIELLESPKEKAVSWNELGNAYRCIDDYNNAILAYQQADELDPDTAGARDRFGNFHVEANSRNARVWNDLGRLFFKTGSYEEAAQAYYKAIELEPAFGWPYSNLALTLVYQGDHLAALPLYKKSLELLKDDRDQAICWNRLGNAYRKLNDYDRANAAYQQAVKLNNGSDSLVTRTRFSLLSNCFID